jgi:hypothetical protein
MRNSIAVILLLIPVSINAQTLTPLKQWVKTSNLNSSVDVGYLGARCSSLYAAGAYYLEYNGNKSDLETVKSLRARGDAFRNVSLALDMQVNKKSNEAIIAQGKLLSETYTKMIVHNKQLNGNALGGVIMDDFEVCASHTSSFDKLNQSIPK